MAPPPDDKKPEKSYLSSAVDSINPWGGHRSSTPTPKDPLPDPAPVNPGDHSTTSTYGRSFKRYPPDCPPLAVQWFHAVDVPKRKPEWVKSKTPKETKLPPPPKKYVAFSKPDNRALEAAYQKVVEASENERDTGVTRRYVSGSQRGHSHASQDTPNTSMDAAEATKQKEPGIKVPVNEDFLFDVDIEERELAPAYWLGPTYDVRRGSWFYQEGSSLRPCEENLASQLEEGYLKVKPWLYPARARSESKASDVTPKASVENLKAAATTTDGSLKPATSTPQHQPQTHRLFGTYMNNIATYQDVNTAWLSSDGVLSWVTSTMYERFAGGAYMSGVKLVRGYSEPKKAKEEKGKENKSKDEQRPTTPAGTKLSSDIDEKEQRALKRRSAPPSSRSDHDSENDGRGSAEFETRGSRLQRQLSSLIESAENRDPEKEEEEIRKREEKEIQDDYNAQAGESQGRDIEHLILVTHGIGQLLGLRMESVNFVHDVNVLRKTLKSVYSTSADLRALNAEIGEGPGNCRIQVLPVCWRHLLDFPKRKGEKRREQDLGETFEEEDEYPSLEDITVEGVAFARSLIADLALDVLLYQSAYREQISEIVFRESNRIYKLFMERNPGFHGKVHVMGHSLGSAIMFDILCRQKEPPQGHDSLMNPLRFWPAEKREQRDPKDLSFEFDVEDFYCLGSPIGLFQMLKGRTISARHLPNAMPSESPLNPDELDDPFATAVPLAGHAGSDQRISPITGLPVSISSPKVSQLYNVFHPSDPISYRLEPLISSAMSSLKPQVLPYTKKGIFSNVSNPQNIMSDLGAKVGQSVSGLWSSLSAGIANNLLNRSLGLTQEEVANFNAQHPPHASSPGAGTNVGAGVISNASALSGEKAAARKRQLAMLGGDGDAAGRKSISGNDMTLIDDELETLYSRFQKDRVETLEKEGGGGGDGKDDAKAKAAAGVAVSNWMEEERKAQRLRREEMKVRALNRNGRVDYSIQESVLDFNPINTIASHMAYWSDEDVSHFIMSQLLSNKDRSTSPSKAGTPGQGRAANIVEWDHLE